MDFGNFSPRDAYYSVQQQSSINNHDLNLPSFPIGTFSVDTVSSSSSSAQNQNQSIFSNNLDGGNNGGNGGGTNNRSRSNVFNSSPRSVTNGIGNGSSGNNGGGGGNNGGNSSNGTTSYNNGNNNSSDNQGTRETGIIEKLLVRFYQKKNQINYIFHHFLINYYLYSIHMDLFNAVKDKLVSFFIFHNLVAILSI